MEEGRIVYFAKDNFVLVPPDILAAYQAWRNYLGSSVSDSYGGEALLAAFSFGYFVSQLQNQNLSYLNTVSLS